MSWPVGLFDLDGTLTDPEQGIVNCIRHAYAALGRKAPPLEALRSWIGPPLYASFLAAFDGDEPAAQAGVAAYRERFGSTGLFENRVIDGIEDALIELNRRGIRCLVATSKPTVYAKQIVEHFGLDRQIDRIYGSELDGTRTDKAELLRHMLDVESIDPRQAVMIGDRYHDIVGARRNGIATIGVTWGFGSRAELEDAGATHVAETVTELIEHWH